MTTNSRKRNYSSEEVREARRESDRNRKRQKRMEETTPQRKM